jgi:hypothetical protein
MTPEAKRFILFHEEGHLVLQTKNELEADRYAFQKYVGEGHSLKAGVKALTRVLGDSPNHIIRSQAILNHAKNYQDSTMSNMTGDTWITPAWDNFLGFGKKAKAKREARREMRTERKEVKQEAKLTRIDARAQKKVDKNERRNVRVGSKAEQKVALAQFGVTPGGEALKGIGQTVAGLAKGVAAVTTGGLSELMNPGVPPAAPNTNMRTLSPAEQQFATSTGFSPLQESLMEKEQGFETMGFFPDTPGKKNKSLFPMIGLAVVALVVIGLIMRKP